MRPKVNQTLWADILSFSLLFLTEMIDRGFRFGIPDCLSRIFLSFFFLLKLK